MRASARSGQDPDPGFEPKADSIPCSEIRVSLLGRQDEATPDRMQLERGRRGRSRCRRRARGLALAIAGLTAAVDAQVPGPESFAQEPPDADGALGRGRLPGPDRAGQAGGPVPRQVRREPARRRDLDRRSATGTGLGSILRLDDDPATRPFAEPLVDEAGGGRAAACDPARADRPVRRRADQDRPRSRTTPSSGSGRRVRTPCPFLVEALERPGISAEERALLVAQHGPARPLGGSGPCSPCSTAPTPALAADAATALGRIGDPRAVPFLTYPAAAADVAAGGPRRRRARRDRAADGPAVRRAAAHAGRRC